MIVHHLSKRQIKHFALEKRANGEYFNRSQAHLEDQFCGSIDRFCDIAFAFRNALKVLDAGSGDGLLLALLKMLGHEVFSVDLFDHTQDQIYKQHQIPFLVCNIEADPLPFEANFFDAVSCCQAFEHFTHSHLQPILEMKRVLKPGGMIEIDVPNAAGYRNRSRMLRGKHITYDYKEHYLYAKPVLYKGREYYPARHNREFTLAELELLLCEAGFTNLDARFLKSRRHREGFEQIKSLGTALKDAVPPLRKSLMIFGTK